MSKPPEKPSKENIQHFKKWNLLTFFLCLWINFALLDPGRIANPEDPIEYGSNPDLQHGFADPSGSGSPTLGNLILPCTVKEVPVTPPAFATGVRFPPAAEWRDLAQLWQSHRQRGRHPSARLLRGTNTARHYFCPHWNNGAMWEKHAGLMQPKKNVIDAGRQVLRQSKTLFVLGSVPCFNSVG